MNDTYQCKLDEAVNKEALKRKIKGIDFKTLVETTTARFEALVEDPTVDVYDEDITRRFLEDCKTAAPKRFLMDHHSTLIKLLRTLSMTILLQHLKELMPLETSKGKRPVEGFKAYSSTGTIHVLVRSSGVHPVAVNVSNRPGLDILLEWTVDGQEPRDQASRNITYTKMILELLVMDDHTPEAVEAYAKTQHDWCLSSIIGTIELSSRLYEKRFLETLVTALVYGCQTTGHDGFKTRLMDVYISDDPQNDKNDMMSFVNSVARMSGGIQYDGGNCYDPLRLESLISRIRSYGDGVINWVMPYPSRLGDTPSYRRTVCSYVYYCSKSNFLTNQSHACHAVGLPDLEKAKITRGFLMELEDKTHFIKNSIVRGVLGHQAITMLDPLIVEDGSMDPTSLQYVIKDKMRLFRSCYTDAYFFSSDTGVVSNEPAPTMWRPGTGGLLDEHRIMRYCERSNPDETSPYDRYLAFMKLYLLHKIVRLNECLPEADKDFEVTPFEKLVMDDVLYSMDAAHLKGLTCVDEDSEWYKDFTDECVSVCEDPELAKELHDLELPENMRKEYFEGRVNRLEAVKLGSLHQRMAGGDLKDLEERFERLDEAMIDVLIDHFLSCRMGRTDGMPEEFVLEDLRMDAPNRYEAALAV